MIDLWTPKVLKIYQALEGQMRLVGGCVRDFLLGKAPSDIDLITPLLPHEALERLGQKGIKAHPISPRHGLIEITMDGEQFEMTTLRHDSYESGKQKVSFITDYEQDARRRDFTINALSMDREQIYDYFDGKKDLKLKQIRFIGEPAIRIAEDPLRMLRYIRFWASFGGDKPDPDVLDLFPRYSDKLMQVSLNRRKKEFSKIIMGPRVLEALNLVRQGNLLPTIVKRDGLDDLSELLRSNPNASYQERLLCFNNYI